MTIALTTDANSVIQGSEADIDRLLVWMLEKDQFALANVFAGTWKATYADLIADLAHADGALGAVTDDSDITKIGLYRKSGASGAGTWVQFTDYIPGNQIVYGANNNSTNDAINLTGSPRYGGGTQLVWFVMPTTNANGPITISVDGSTAVPVRTVSGGNPSINALTAGMPVQGIMSGTEFLLFSDLASAAIQAAVEAAALRAETAAALTASGIRQFRESSNYISDTVLSYTSGTNKVVVLVGDIVGIGVIGYEVIASGATDQDFTNANGVKVKLADVGKYDYPGASGGTAPQTLFWQNSARAAIRAGMADPAPTDDQTGRGALAQASPDWWNDVNNIGLGSAAFNRNNLAYGTYTFGIGHDNTATGTASFVGGAGSYAGDPNDPDNTGYAFKGYCSFSFGRNCWAQGEKSIALGEEADAFGRASLAAGYFAVAGTENSFAEIGQIALGDRVLAQGDGAAAIGRYINALNGGHVLGSGINDGSRLEVSGTVGIGHGVTRPTFQVKVGPGTTNGTAGAILRSAQAGAAQGLDIADYDGGVKAQINVEQVNSGSGGSWSLQLNTNTNGSTVRGFDIETEGTPSLLPAGEFHRVGSATRRMQFIFLANAPNVLSDKRKKDILGDGSIDDAILDAWATVKHKKYRLKNDPEKLQFGYIAQDIVAAFALTDIEATDTGLVSKGKDGFYGVNYTMCEIVEAAYQRRRMDRIEAKLAELEA